MANPSLALEQDRYQATRKNFRLSRLSDTAALLALIIFMLIMLLPLFMVTINSFKTEDEYYAGGPFALPQTWSLDVIARTWNNTAYTTKLINSTIISLSTAVLATALSLFNAYALGIGKVKGRTFLLILFLMAITLPTESLAYPLYYFFKLI